MRIPLAWVLLLCTSCIKRAPGSSPAAAGAVPLDATVKLAPAERHQRLEGFGASVAWYLDKITRNPPPGLDDVLFKELGLDIIRFRNRWHRTELDDRDTSQEVEILRRATRSLGHAPRILMSSWAPPGALKANGQERCKSNKDCTLVKENGQFVYDKFGDYWHDSLVDYAKLGIVPE